MGKIQFYKDRIALNCLAKDMDNAVEICEAMEGYAAVGVLSKQFDNAEQGIEVIKKYLDVLPCVSVGLGSGDPNQWEKAAWIAAELDSGHVNQVFTSAPVAKGMLMAKGKENTKVNCLVSPTGIAGKVKVSTGPLSSLGEDGILDIDIVARMMKDMQVDAIKFFPMGEMKSMDELKAVAEACAQYDLMLEPTGSLGLHNLEEVIQIALDAGVKKMMPHIYNSIIDKETGLTKIEDVKAVMDIFKKMI